MKKYKKLLSLLLAIMLLITSAPLTASAETYGDLTYKITDGEVTITDCNESATAVIIPSTINGYPVTSIGDKAFAYCNKLTSITIGNGVTSIGDDAFYACSSLTNIIVDENNKYYLNDEYGVLFNADKTELILYPHGNSRSSYTIPDGVTKISDEAFWGCDLITSITIPDSVTTIGDYAFYSCRALTSINIPDNVISIGYAAFLFCDSLTKITIPGSVTSIGEIAFAPCNSLADFVVDEDNKYYSNDEYGVLFNYNKTELVQYPSGNNRNSYSIPDGVTSIGERAFYNCKALTTITMSDSVTSIDNEAFSYCESLTSISLPDSVTSIGDNAFFNCNSLANITIGNGVTSIGNYAFRSCESLINVSLPGSVISIGNGAFMSCESLTSISLHNSVTSIGSSAFSKCLSLESIIINNPKCEIYDSSSTIYSDATIYGYPGSTAEAYAEKYNREFVALEAESEIIASGICGENVTWKLDAEGTLTISGTGDMYNYDTSPWYDDGYNANIKNVVIENGVTSVGVGAFAYCENLTAVSIPESVTSIGDLAFAYCENLTEIAIPEGVTTIGAGVFAYCENLAEVSIPASVTTIGAVVFANCYKIEKVTIAENNEYYSTDDHALFNKDKTELVSFYGNTDTYIIPDGVTAICDNAFTGCDSVTNITIPDSVTYIGYYTFLNCTNLVSITLPESMTSIGIFKGCTNLKSIIIPDGITTIDDYCFENCKSLESITIAESVTHIGYDAFVGCENLANITILGTIKEAHDSLGNTKCYNNSENWDNGVLYVDNHIFAVKENEISETYTIRSGTKSICIYSFSSCFQLKSIIIPDSVTYIGMWAFNNSEIESIFIYNPDCEIYDSEFTIYSGTTIYGYAGSTAEAFATENGNTFIEIEKECEHEYEEVVTEPTCTEQGFTTYTCKECGDAYIDSYVDATGHDYVEVITTPATHTAEGLKTFTCDCGDSYTESIEKLEGHTYESVVTEPTCTEGGFTTYTCACGDSYTDNRTEALGHNILNSVCKRCGYEIDVQVTIGTVTGRPGETVQVYFTLDKETDIKSMSIHGITYDSDKVTLINGEWLTEGEILSDWNQSEENGVITFKENTPFSGDIFRLTFEIKEEIEDCEVPVNCVFRITSRNENKVETVYNLAIIPGCINIINIFKGDVNGDDFVDSDDAIHLLYHSLIPERYEVNQNCDFNGDGNVDSDDAIYLLYYTMIPERYPLT